MPRRRQKLPRLPRPLIKGGLVLIIVGFVALICFNQLALFLKDSDYFNITAVHCDPSLDFIKDQDLKYLKSQNIFSVDLIEVQERLALKYPQVTQLRIVKRFPSEIVIAAQKRIPFAQAQVAGRVLTIDANGVVISNTADPELPLLAGIKTDGKVALGLPLQSQNLPVGLKILKSFSRQDNLNAYKIAKLDIGNLSEIVLLMSNKINIILDRDAADQKIGLISMVLSQPELDLKTVKYIDLRFKEPILGKK